MLLVLLFKGWQLPLNSHILLARVGTYSAAKVIKVLLFTLTILPPLPTKGSVDSTFSYSCVWAAELKETGYLLKLQIGITQEKESLFASSDSNPEHRAGVGVRLFFVKQHTQADKMYENSLE